MGLIQKTLDITTNKNIGFILTTIITLIIIIWCSYSPWQFSNVDDSGLIQDVEDSTIFKDIDDSTYFKNVNGLRIFQIFMIIFAFITMIYSYFLYKKRDPIYPIWNTNDLFNSVGMNVYIFLFMMISIILIIYGFFKLCKDVNIAYIITNYSLQFFMFMGFLSVLYICIKPLFKNKKHTFELLKMTIFYLPCLFIDIVEYFKNQYKITTPTIWLILLFDIIVILCYFLLPILLHKINLKTGTQLLKDPVYLNNELTVGNYENLHKKNDEKKKKDKNFLYNYSISFWYYINPQPSSTSEAYTEYTNILNYGNRPKIEYNGKTKTLKVSCYINDNKTEEIFSTNKILFQKWNNLVINFDGGNMDIFINNELVKNQINITPLMSYEKIIVGSKNGINGGICNIVYHDKVLSKSDIELNYNLMKNLTPPIINNF